MESIVAIYVFDGTITSEPIGNSKHLNDKFNASRPDATPTQYSEPVNFAKFCSKFSTLLPIIYHPDSRIFSNSSFYAVKNGLFNFFKFSYSIMSNYF